MYHRKNLLTGEKLDKLQSLVDAGKLDWGIAKVDHNDERWEQHFSLLLDFRKSHGHCNVPERYTLPGNGENSSEKVYLGKWLERQRLKLRTNTMRPDRLTQLTALISEGALSSGAAKDDDVRWNQCYQALLEFGRIFKHCNVPYKCDVEVEWGESNDGTCVVKSLRVKKAASAEGGDGKNSTGDISGELPGSAIDSSIADGTVGNTAGGNENAVRNQCDNGGEQHHTGGSSSSKRLLADDSASAVEKSLYGYDDVPTSEGESDSESVDSDRVFVAAVEHNPQLSTGVNETAAIAGSQSTTTSAGTGSNQSSTSEGGSWSLIRLGKWLSGQRYLCHKKQHAKHNRRVLLQSLVDKGLLRWGEVYLDKTIKWESS